MHDTFFDVDFVDIDQNEVGISRTKPLVHHNVERSMLNQIGVAVFWQKVLVNPPKVIVKQRNVLVNQQKVLVNH